ncbi:MAG TPA: response regulator transcription factor [Candidatus Dormibacteraeota bacterium]|jgi:DNA-binding response OmpR family regulator|nr:response regulator transcription factor [Candidatus Dormibacteraeota bacterium]
MNPPRRDRVLVVDDDAKIVVLISAYLERAGYEVAGVHDGLAALEVLRRERFDAVVLDVMLPRIDGIGVAGIVRDEGGPPILMLTALGNVPDRVRGLDSGADDYLAKPFAPSELVARVRSLLRRSRPRPATGNLRQGDLELDLDRRTVRLGGERCELTTMEFGLLAALVGAEGRVLSRGQLIDALAAEADEPILERSIDAYVGRIRSKLGDTAGRPRYIETVRGVGYRVVSDE